MEGVNKITQPRVDMNQKLKEEKESLEQISSYYKKFGSDYKICECESCSKLLLPFMVHQNMSDTYRETILKEHSEYCEKYEAISNCPSSSGKLTNSLYKNVWLAEVTFLSKANI